MKRATHQNEAYGTITLYRLVPDFVGTESGTQYYCWAMWDGREWIPDKLVSSRRFTKVANFSELHDYVDANYYGGFCDDETAEAFIAQYGGRDHNEGYPDGYMHHINTAQTAIGKWLETGRK